MLQNTKSWEMIGKFQPAAGSRLDTTARQARPRQRALGAADGPTVQAA